MKLPLYSNLITYRHMFLPLFLATLNIIIVLPTVEKATLFIHPALCTSIRSLLLRTMDKKGHVFNYNCYIKRMYMYMYLLTSFFSEILTGKQFIKALLLKAP